MYGAKRKIREKRRKEKDVFNILEDKVISLEKIRKKYISHIEKQVHKHFVSNGGCLTCRGRGWVVNQINDEGDPSFSTCDNPLCDQDTRKKSGLDVGYDRHDRSRGVVNPCGRQNAMYAVLVTPIDTMICSLMSQIVKERRREEMAQVCRDEHYLKEKVENKA